MKFTQAYGLTLLVKWVLELQRPVAVYINRNVEKGASL